MCFFYWSVLYEGLHYIFPRSHCGYFIRTVLLTYTSWFKNRGQISIVSPFYLYNYGSRFKFYTPWNVPRRLIQIEYVVPFFTFLFISSSLGSLIFSEFYTSLVLRIYNNSPSYFTCNARCLFPDRQWIFWFVCE